MASQIKLQLAWLAKYLCEVEVIWQLYQLKSGYDGEVSFVTILQSDYNDNKCDQENKQYVHHQVRNLATRFSQ